MPRIPHRQGDVLLIPAPELPSGAIVQARDAGRVILAYGEVTGHAHAILDQDVDLYATAEAADRWLRVGQSGASVVHEEHAPHRLEPGIWLVRRQREYSPEELRYVAD